jgi:ferredoxin/flavodoxin
MSNFRVAIVYFSPGGNTRKAAEMARDALTDRGLSVQMVNVTDAKVVTDPERLKDFVLSSIKPHDLVMVGGPVYENRLDRHTMQIIRSLPPPEGTSWGVLAAPFVTWGGVTSGIALHQAAKALRSSGRRVVLALKLQGFHPFSIEWSYRLCEGMPGDEAIPVMRQLADKVAELADTEPGRVKDITGLLNYAPPLVRVVGGFCSIVPTQEYTFRDVRVDAEKCQACGVCVKHCPLDRLEIRDGRAQVKTGAVRCMHCYTCLNVCPNHARYAGLKSMEKLLTLFARRYADRPPIMLYS